MTLGCSVAVMERLLAQTLIMLRASFVFGARVRKLECLSPDQQAANKLGCHHPGGAKKYWVRY